MRHIIIAGLIGLASAWPMTVATRQPTAGATQTFEATGRIVRVPGDESNPPCFISVDAWQVGSWREQLYDLVSGEGVAYQVPAGMRTKEGQPDRTPQGQADVERVTYALETALAFSEDMRTKVRDACRHMGTWINIRLVRNDPTVDGGTYIKGTNTAFLDLGDLDAEQFLPGSDDNPQAAVASRLAKSQNVRTTLAHEIDHMRGLGHHDPLPEEQHIFKGLPVIDENRVMDDLGFPLERLEYATSSGAVRYRAFDTTLYLTRGPHAHAGAEEAHRLPPSAMKTIADLGPFNSVRDGEVTDLDRDGIPFHVDTCPAQANPAQGFECSAAVDPRAGASGTDQRRQWQDFSQHFYSRYIQESDLRAGLNLGWGWRVPSDDLDASRLRLESSALVDGSALTLPSVLRAPVDPGQGQDAVWDSPEPVSVPTNATANRPQKPRSPRSQHWLSFFGRAQQARVDASTTSGWLWQTPKPRPEPDAPRAAFAPSAKIFFTSLGASTGDAVQMTVVNDGSVPVEIRSDGFSLIPIAKLTARDVERELQRLAGRPRVTVTLKAYCRDFGKPVPAAGTVMRLADNRVQATMRPIQDMFAAARHLLDQGTLKPDVERDLYLDSIRQWALWTMQERFDERAFASAFAAHTRKNVEAAGERWRPEYDREIRELAAVRWRAVQQVLRASSAR